MNTIDWEKLSRTYSHDKRDFVILRPGIALVLYSHAELPEVMKATAEVLTGYLDFVPPEAIAAKYEEGPDEYTPGHWKPFNSAARAALLSELRSGLISDEEEGYGFVLIATSDGQAGDYGVKLGGINLAAEDDEEETSILRLEFPSSMFDVTDVSAFLHFVNRAAESFPFCCGHAGLSFIYTLAFVPEAREEIDKLLPRFLGFDCGHTSMQHGMRGKSPPAHWLNLLDADLVNALGGQEKLRTKLAGCEVKRLGGGMLVRAAKLPPIVDVNRGGLDIGCLPTVAQVLKPLRIDKALYVALEDADHGRAWLERFDDLASRDWDNR